MVLYNSGSLNNAKQHKVREMRTWANMGVIPNLATTTTHFRNKH